MALSTPTIKEIRTQIVSDIEGEIGQTVPIFAKSVWWIWSFVLAGVWIILYKYGTDAYKQRFAQTANRTFLILLGEPVRVFIKSATTWIGQAEVVSTTASGNLDAGTQLVNNNTGVVYTVVNTVTLAVGTVTFDLQATKSGALGDLNVSDEINFVTTIPGLAEIATISAITTAGSDEEDLEEFRKRVIDGYQKKPQGGAEADYEQWGEEAPNVINIYPYAGTNPGEVDVYVEVDNQTDGIPTQDQLDATEQHIIYDPITGKKNRRPVNAEPLLKAITRKVFNLTVLALSPDDTDTRTAIDNAVTKDLKNKAPYLQGLTITRNDTISKAELTSIVQKTASAYGATISSVTVESGGSDIDLHVLGKGEKAKAGTISYV